MKPYTEKELKDALTTIYLAAKDKKQGIELIHLTSIGLARWVETEFIFEVVEPMKKQLIIKEDRISLLEDEIKVLKKIVKLTDK